MVMRFGTKDHLQCITVVRVDPQNEFFPGKPVCLGHKFSVSWFGVPYRTADDGYVLMPGDGGRYIRLDRERIAELQDGNVLPTPLPAYTVPVEWRVAGYGLWAVIGVLVVAGAVGALWRRRLARAREVTPLATSGPVIAKPGDREIQARFAEMLEPGESVSHQALTYDRPTGEQGVQRRLVALTDRRLLISTTGAGVFGLGRGAPRLLAIPRTEIVRVTGEDERITVERVGGGEPLVMIVASMPRGFTRANQRAFLFDLPRLLNLRGPLPEARVVS